MNTFADKTRKTHLIWLVSLAMLFSPGVGDSGNCPTVKLHYSKQSELTLKPYDQKSSKKTFSAYTVFSAKHIIGFTGDLSFRTRILLHTQISALKLKKSREHLVSPSIKTKHLRFVAAMYNDENPSLLKG